MPVRHPVSRFFCLGIETIAGNEIRRSERFTKSGDQIFTTHGGETVEENKLLGLLPIPERLEALGYFLKGLVPGNGCPFGIDVPSFLRVHSLQGTLQAFFVVQDLKAYVSTRAGLPVGDTGEGIPDDPHSLAIHGLDASPTTCRAVETRT